MLIRRFISLTLIFCTLVLGLAVPREAQGCGGGSVAPMRCCIPKTTEPTLSSACPCTITPALPVSELSGLAPAPVLWAALLPQALPLLPAPAPLTLPAPKSRTSVVLLRGPPLPFLALRAPPAFS